MLPVTFITVDVVSITLLDRRSIRLFIFGMVQISFVLLVVLNSLRMKLNNSAGNTVTKNWDLNVCHTCSVHIL